MKQRDQNGFIFLTGTFLVLNTVVLNSKVMLVCTLSKRYTHTGTIQKYRQCTLSAQPHMQLPQSNTPCNFMANTADLSSRKKSKERFVHLKATCERQSSRGQVTRAQLAATTEQKEALLSVLLHLILPLWPTRGTPQVVRRECWTEGPFLCMPFLLKFCLCKTKNERHRTRKEIT